MILKAIHQDIVSKFINIIALTQYKNSIKNFHIDKKYLWLL